jgi:hypothetical protein
MTEHLRCAQSAPPENMDNAYWNGTGWTFRVTRAVPVNYCPEALECYSWAPDLATIRQAESGLASALSNQLRDLPACVETWPRQIVGVHDRRGHRMLWIVLTEPRIWKVTDVENDNAVQPFMDCPKCAIEVLYRNTPETYSAAWGGRHLVVPTSAGSAR